ncbi:MAG: TIGR01459 family HAD-type hydrolase [Pseudomonadota bacterium]
MSPTILSSIDEIVGAYDALLVDLWGCYHNGLTPYPAAVDALRRFRDRGGLVVLLTNAPRPAGSVRGFLASIGAPEESWDGIMSSGEACQRALGSRAYGSHYYYVGPDRDLHMLGDVGLAPVTLEDAEAILCTGLFDDATEGPEHYAERIADWRDRGLSLLCANPDVIVDRGDLRLYCAGAIAEAYEAAGGTVVWFGKPHRPTYDQSFALIEELAGRPVPRQKVLAMGDGVHTDVKGAIDYGVDVVFVTGGLATAETGGDPEVPDPALLDAFLRSHGQAPGYAIGRLR